MKVIHIEKPIIGESQISKKFKELVMQDLPIHRWEMEQKAKRSKMKLI